MLDGSDQKAFQGDFRQLNAMNNRVPGTRDAVESKKDKEQIKMYKNMTYGIKVSKPELFSLEGKKNDLVINICT